MGELMVRLLLPLARIALAPDTCALLYASVMPLVFRLRVSPLMAPVTDPPTVDPVAAVVPS